MVAVSADRVKLGINAPSDVPRIAKKSIAEKSIAEKSIGASIPKTAATSRRWQPPPKRRWC